VEYKVDLRDVKFQLFEWLATEKLLQAERFAEWDAESIGMVLDEALKIAQEQLSPTNVDGDRIGAQWKDGVVTSPESFHTAYKTVAEGGWVGLINSPEYGGMGLPHTVGTAVNEFFFGSNMALFLTILLTRGAAALAEEYGTQELSDLYCEKMYSGQWAGTMCLTEPQAGSDLGATKTKAVKQDDGSYMISGEKIFITAGEQDLTENIIHLLLARIPGAPEGTKGISLFLVPKIRVNPDGSLGEPNDVYCGNIEEKLGIHGSPTCSLVFGQKDGCQGFLVGEENKGMRMMFMMMNAARIEVGLQGAALAGAAHQAATDYAKERLQSRHWTKMGDKTAPPVPIIEHPDVRRMLLSSKAYILTPICKGWSSKWGFQVTDWCLEVFGGYGYTCEYPAEQYLRDAKIACIYEGTNGIQALDLVGRKLPMKGGKPVRELLGMAERTFNKLKGDPQLMEPAWLLAAALKQIETISKELMKRPDGPAIMVLNAVPMLDMIGTILGAHYLLDQAALAKKKLADICAEREVDQTDKKAYAKLLEDVPDAAFYHNKVVTAIHFAHRALPTVPAQAAAIRSAEMGPMEAVL